MLMNKRAGVLPADPLVWGQDVSAELITRLPSTQPYILEARVIYHNDDGNGLVLVILQFQNGRAFVPAVIKEWKLQPMDVLMYKEQKDVKYRYLSERNLINAATFVGMGTPLGNKKGIGLPASAVGLNLSVPAGGLGGRMAMPSYSYARSKLASNDPAIPNSHAYMSFFAEYVRDNTSYWRTSKSASLIAPEEITTMSRYALLVQTPEGQNELYSDRREEPVVLTDEQVGGLLSQDSKDPFERAEKAASYLNNGVRMLGNVITRMGNIQLNYTPDYIDSDIPEPHLPANPGVFMSNGQVTYVNPHMTYLDGSPYGYAMVVQPGGYVLTQDLSGFHFIQAPESATLSKEDLLSQAHPEKLQPGTVITLIDGKSGSASVPCKVLLSTRTANNIMIRVTPLFGDVGPVNLLFYRGTERKWDPLNPEVLLVPFTETQIHVLPNFVKTLGQLDSTNQERGKLHVIQIYKGGGHNYTVKEDGHWIGKQLKYGELAFRLIRRYGFGDAQAAKILKSLDTERSKQFSVKYFLDESSVVATPTGEVDSVDQLIARKTASIAQGLYDVDKGISAEVVEAGQLLDTQFRFITEKCAGDESGAASTSNTPQSPEQTQNSTSARPQFMDMAAKQTPVAKDTQEVIDLLTFYSLGKFRGEEATQVLSKLEESLKEAEGYLCKILLMTQLDRIPGHQYADVKVLLSDLDSYISSIVSSRVLIRGAA